MSEIDASPDTSRKVKYGKKGEGDQTLYQLKRVKNVKIAIKFTEDYTFSNAFKICKNMRIFSH